VRGVSAQAPLGIKTEFDILIYATGFDGVTGAYDRIDIRGQNGLRLKDAGRNAPQADCNS
jgi:hypothetical protein